MRFAKKSVSFVGLGNQMDIVKVVTMDTPFLMEYVRLMLMPSDQPQMTYVLNGKTELALNVLIGHILIQKESVNKFKLIALPGMLLMEYV